MGFTEPRFKPEHIKIIFDDQGTTQALLQILGIETTCVLGGDDHHLMVELWPINQWFGSLLFE